MTILFAASEMGPFARTGGLGDVLEALPAALAARGHDVSVVIPCYHGLREDITLGIRSSGVRISVYVSEKSTEAEIFECTAPNGVQVFLVAADAYFDRPALYGETGTAYPDNAERFIFFSKVVVELSRRMLPPPEIIHVHDWQTGLVPALIKHRRLPFKTVFTIHNLAYQGSFWAFDFNLTGLPGEYFAPGKNLEFFGNMNLLKGGIVLADAITTVSDRYAREIQTPEYGCGLDVVMREHAGKLSGILNGADYDLWNPEQDAYLPSTFGLSRIAGKQACKEALLAKLGLDPEPIGPVFAMVSRLVSQKGIDLLLPILDRLLADDVRLVMLGEGDPIYERELMIASRQHKGRFAFQREMDVPLAHLIEGGADISLIPSFFEPCGLSAMYGLKYGTIPIARATGDLQEIIHDFDPNQNRGNGVLFFEPTAEAFWDAILRAKRLFRDKTAWTALVERAMACDFSWEKSVEKYEAVYQRLLAWRKS